MPAVLDEKARAAVAGLPRGDRPARPAGQPVRRRRRCVVSGPRDARRSGGARTRRAGLRDQRRRRADRAAPADPAHLRPARAGLARGAPAAAAGATRWRDIELLREVAELTSTGIGLEGVRRILELEHQVDALQHRVAELEHDLAAAALALRQTPTARRRPQPPRRAAQTPPARSPSGAAAVPDGHDMHLGVDQPEATFRHDVSSPVPKTIPLPIPARHGRSTANGCVRHTDANLMIGKQPLHRLVIIALAASALLASALPAAAADAIVVASKIDTEGALLGNLTAEIIEANGLPVRRRIQLGPTNIVRAALLAGQIDIYPE